jgi:predicted acylesterase/phospholipase RssA
MANGLRLGIVLSGTAPAMTLMSGAMLAFAKHNVTFDVISTTGVGALIGMLYLAPKNGKTPEEALRELPNLFVSDWLYRLVPMNFKVFHKYGPFAERFYQLRKSLPKFPLAPDDPNPVKRFMNDWMELWATALTPRSYQSSTKGLMSHVPLIDDLVEFPKLKAMQPQTRFYVNAFSLYSKRLRFFDMTP